MALRKVHKYVLVECPMEHLKAGDMFALDDPKESAVYFCEIDGFLIENPPEPGKAEVQASWLVKGPVDSKPQVLKLENVVS